MGVGEENQPPVKLFFALMSGQPELFEACERALREEFGPLDERSEPFAFDPYTSYYEREFGVGLEKRIVAARDLIAPERLAGIKLRTNRLELELTSPAARESDRAKRAVNVDPGYLNDSKVVLATTKDQAHRIYVGRGIFEEVTLNYRRSSRGYEPNPWTYPDYAAPGRLEFFGRLREVYREQIERNA